MEKTRDAEAIGQARGPRLRQGIRWAVDALAAPQVLVFFKKNS